MDRNICFEISDSGYVVRIEPLQYNTYNSTSYCDNNWVKSKVYIKAGAFSGEYLAELMTTDFTRFRSEFIALYDNLSGGATFDDIEGYLNIKILGDGFGHFELKVAACDRPGVNASYLTFSMNIDQTYIKGLVHQLETIVKEFPVKGRAK